MINNAKMKHPNNQIGIAVIFVADNNILSSTFLIYNDII